MPWVKRFGRSDAVRAVVCRAVALYIRAIWRTTRWEREGYEYPKPFHAARVPYIGAFWHGRLLMMPYGWPRILPLAMLISPHGDGRLIAEAVNRLGVDIIPGSSNRGASVALRALVRTLQHGSCVAITPDGPDGPAMTASAGVIQVARLSGVPIFPITYATSRRRVLESWDRFHLPLPFGRGIFLVDPPIHVPADADDAKMESLRILLETRLRAITAEADRRMGHGAVAPGTLSRDAFRARRRAVAGSARAR